MPYQSRPWLLLLFLFVAHVGLQAAERPNILWITSEDKGISWVGCYGSKNAKTHDHFAEALALKTTDKWVALKKGVTPEEIDVEQQLGKLDNCSVFVRTTLVSPIDQEVSISAACDDWVSAIIAHGRSITGSIKLNKGENQLILKLIEKGGGWKFHCRITKNHRAVEGLTHVAK